MLRPPPAQLRPEASGRRVQMQLEVLYFFAGQKRRADVAAFARRLSVPARLEEVDLARSDDADLSNTALQDDYLGRLAAGEWDFLAVSPPCNLWSRVVWTNRRGPSPLRSAQYPWGFPWLESRGS